MTVDSTVRKMAPEESALVANLASLVDELRAMGSGVATPQPAPGAGEEVNMTGSELDPKNGNPQNPVAPQGPAAPKESPMPKRDEDNTAVDKIAKAIRKAMQASNDDGTTANEDAEEKLEDGLPEGDEENINEVAKAIVKALYSKKGVAKSARSQVNDDVAELVRVVKAQNARIARQDAVLAEVLEGLGAVPPAPAEASVRKSAGTRRPVAGYDGGADFIDAIAKAVVAKSGGSRPAAGDEEPSSVRKSMVDFTEGFGKMGRGLWG